MSYRLIDANALTHIYPDNVNMPYIIADLPNGLDGKHYDMRDKNRGTWLYNENWLDGNSMRFICQTCGHEQHFITNYCPECGTENLWRKK